MRRMAGRVVRIAARIVFFVGGAVSIAIGYLFWSMRGTGLPYQSEWPIFAGVPLIAGAVSVIAAILPRKWTARLCRTAPDDPTLLSLPGKPWVFLAAVSYLIALAFYFTPLGWHPGLQSTFSLCVVCGISTSIDPSDPSLLSILLMLAPVNAAIYGSIGLTLGYARLAFRRHR